MTEFAWVISGDTYHCREDLKRMGFHWQGNQKRVWAKLKDIRDFEGNAELKRWVKVNELVLTEEYAEKYIVGSRRWYRSQWA